MKIKHYRIHSAAFKKAAVRQSLSSPDTVKSISHGQPGRAARGERAAGAGQLSGPEDERGRYVPVLVQDDPRKRARRHQNHEPIQ